MKTTTARLKALSALALLLLGYIGPGLVGAEPRAWMDPKRSADERATLVLREMTLGEKILLLHGYFAETAPPPGAIPAAGYVPGIPRLGLPALFETDASLGISNPLGVRLGDVATALPAGLALAATFDPDMAHRAGTLLGEEARAKGFNVLLGGGVNLTRDPRNGRNFEYLGEDPWLAGRLAGAEVRGTQDQHVVSTVKHFALNDTEGNRMTLDARIDPRALRESDLLAFQLAIEQGAPGSVMCAYNQVNGVGSCGNDWLLNQVLKGAWRFPGWVMSDWGAVHGVQDGLKGLDQESGQQFDRQVWFDAPLRAAVASGSFPKARIDDMVHRLLRSLFAVGIVDHPPERAAIDYPAHSEFALEEARQGIVLLKNESAVLPLARDLRRIAVIGGHAHLGVLSGGGSAQVRPSNGPAIIVPVGGRGELAMFREEYFMPSSPLKHIQAAAGKAEVLYDSGSFPQDAAALAKSADVAIVFATRHEMEGYDTPDLTLPNGQDQLIEAVSAANPRTIVVLETGNPVTMPWLAKVKAVLATWYPGQEGGRAIADILFGTHNPAGRLPITFPVDLAHSPRPELPTFGLEPGAPASIEYTEGADVGYRWYLKHAVKPLFPFGFGLSYAAFRYEHLNISKGKVISLTFDVTNTSNREGTDTPQAYLLSIDGQLEPRLIGFQRLILPPGTTKRVTLVVDPRLLARFDGGARDSWRITPGHYAVAVGRSSDDPVLRGELVLTSRTIH